MEKEKVVLPKFNVETYLKDGDAVIDKLKDVEAAANKIHDKGYENIFLLGMGGTYDELEPIQYIMNKYSEVEVHLSNAAELNVLGNKRLNKKLDCHNSKRIRRYERNCRSGRVDC